MRGIKIAGIVFALCSLSAFADDITAEKYPDADVVLVDERVETTYQADGTYVSTEEDWKKALTERGRRSLSSLSIGYSLRYGKGEILLVEIIDAEGKVRAVDFASTLKEATDNSSTSANIYDPLDKVLSCSIPGIKVGETLHVKTRRTVTKSRVKDQWADMEIFESTMPIVRTSVRIDGPLSRPLKKIAVRNPLGNVVSSVVTNGERVVYSWTAENSPQMFPEPAMPPYWTQGQNLRVSTASSWQELSKWYWDVSVPHLEKTNAAMTNKVEEIMGSVGANAAPIDKVRAMYKFVSQEIRYMGLTMEDTSPGYAPHDVDLTFDNRYGVCRDKAALLVAMFRIAGFESYPVLISVSAAKMDNEVPTPFFNHAIVAVKLDGDYILMDPTDESSRDLCPAYLGDCSYLVAHPSGEGLRTAPVVPPSKNAVTVVGSGRLGKDGSLLADHSILFCGINDNAFRRHLLSLKPEQRRELFERAVEGVSAGAELMRCDIEPKDLQDTTKELKVKLLVKYPEVLLRGETRDELSVPSLSSALGAANWLLSGRTSLESRKYPLKVSSTALADEKMEIDLAGAVGATASMPDDETIKGGYEFTRTFRRDGDKLVFERRLSIGAVEFSPDEYLSLRESIKRVEASERKNPTFEKDRFANANERIVSSVRTYDFFGDSSWVSTNTVVKEILTYKGKKNAAELKFSYNPSWKTVELVSACVSNRNGQVVFAGPKETSVLDADWVSSAPRYPASKELVVNLPSVEIGSVIAIVDAKLEDDLSEQSNYMLASQIANAGKVIISRSQESTRDDLRHTIRHLNEVMEMFGCKRRFFCSELGLGPDPSRQADEAGLSSDFSGLSDTELLSRDPSEIPDKGDSLPDPRSDVLKKNWDDLTDDDFAAIASCGYILEDHVKLPFDRENDYDSVYIFKARTTKEDLTGRIRDLFTDSSLGNIFRIKGFMPLEDGSWIELNATHRAIEVKPIERGQEIFIVIGEGLDKNKIAARWADIMGEM